MNKSPLDLLKVWSKRIYASVLTTRYNISVSSNYRNPYVIACKDIFGNQLILDGEDNLIGQIDDLL